MSATYLGQKLYWIVVLSQLDAWDGIVFIMDLSEIY